MVADPPRHPHWKVVEHTVSGAREVRSWKNVPCRHGITCWWARRGCRFQHEERDFVWKEIAQFHNLCWAQQCASNVDESYDQPTKNLDVDEAAIVEPKMENIEKTILDVSESYEQPKNTMNVDESDNIQYKEREAIVKPKVEDIQKTILNVNESQANEEIIIEGRRGIWIVRQARL